MSCARSSYDRFIESCMKDCRCCHECCNLPCDGTMAGGFCDEMCFCPSDEDVEARYEDERKEVAR